MATASRLVDDTNCPRCGCPEYVTVSASRQSWSGSSHQRCRCVHCSHEFYTRFAPKAEKTSLAAEVEIPPTDTVVEYVINRCPACGGRRIPVQRTVGKVRYHRCTECKKRFKSVEGG